MTTANSNPEFRVHLKMGDQHVHVKVTDSLICCFKYNSHSCDWAQFDRDDSLSASDWIQELLPTYYYEVQISGEDAT